MARRVRRQQGDARPRQTTMPEAPFSPARTQAAISRKVALCVLFMSFAMTSAQDTKPAPSTPIDAKKAELGGKTWDPAWDEIVEQAIPAEMLSSEVPRDVRKFCPRFHQMGDTDKRVFWAYFFQALAGAEAGLNPTTRVRHTQAAVNRMDGVSHRPVHQEGLLQLTYEDQARYGCDFDWEQDRELKSKDPSRTILQPKNNLQCGIKILYYQIITQHKHLVTKSSYWSTLHPGTLDYRVFAKEMINPPAACEKPERPEYLKEATTVSVHEQAEQSASAR
jgi:hypothetical protein